MANYLYNGKEFPDINKVYTPELKKTYPHAAICGSGSLVVCTELVRWESNGLYCESGDNVHYCNWVAVANLKWITPTANPKENQYAAYGKPIWSNFDIYDPDGNLVMAASDPIPVNPAAPLDPTSMLMGWLVGRAVASQRGKEQHNE